MPDIPNVWLSSPQIIFATSIALKKHLALFQKSVLKCEMPFTVSYQPWSLNY